MSRLLNDIMKHRKQKEILREKLNNSLMQGLEECKKGIHDGDRYGHCHYCRKNLTIYE